MSAPTTDAQGDDNQVQEFLVRCCWLMVLFSLVAVGCFGAWLGVREYQRNDALKEAKPANVRVTLTWYSTTDPTFKWRGPVADGVYVGGEHDGKKVRVEQVNERVRVGEVAKVIYASSNPQIAQSAYSPVGRWLDYAPWILVAFAVVFLPGAGERLHNAFLPAHRRRTLREVHARRRDFHQSRDLPDAADSGDLMTISSERRDDQHAAGRRAAADGPVTVVGADPTTGSLPVASPLAGASGPDRARGVAPTPVKRSGPKRPVLTGLDENAQNQAPMTDQQALLAPTLTSSQTRVAPAVRSLTPEPPHTADAGETGHGRGTQASSDAGWGVSAVDSLRGAAGVPTAGGNSAAVPPHSAVQPPTHSGTRPADTSGYVDSSHRAADSEQVVLVEGPLRDRSEITEATLSQWPSAETWMHNTVAHDQTSPMGGSEPRTPGPAPTAGGPGVSQTPGRGVWADMPGADATTTRFQQPAAGASQIPPEHQIQAEQQSQPQPGPTAPQTEFHPFVVDLPRDNTPGAARTTVDLTGTSGHGGATQAPSGYQTAPQTPAAQAPSGHQTAPQTPAAQSQVGNLSARSSRPAANRLRAHDPEERVTAAPIQTTGNHQVLSLEADNDLSEEESTEVRRLRSRTRRSKHKAPRSWS